jgi:hypothetical protein
MIENSAVKKKHQSKTANHTNPPNQTKPLLHNNNPTKKAAPTVAAF